MTFPAVIKNSRIAKWATIAIALNMLSLPGVISNQLQSDKSVQLVIPAIDVTPMYGGSTGELVSYYVKNIPADEVASWARWPKYKDFLGIVGVNIALLAWILRLAIREHKFITGDMEIKEIRSPFRNPAQKRD